MRKLLAAGIALLILFSCQPEKKTSASLESFIPINSKYVIKSQDISSFLNSAEKIPFFKNNPNLFDSYPTKNLHIISRYATAAPSLLCFMPNREEGNDFLYLTKQLSENFNLDSIPNKSVETITEKDFTYKKVIIQENTIYTYSKENVFFASNSKSLLLKVSTDSVEKIKPDKSLSMALAAADKDKTSLFINQEYFGKTLKNILSRFDFPIDNLADWYELDFDKNNKDILLNGISTWNPSSDNLLKIFSNVSPEINKLAQVTPINADGFISFAYKDFSELNTGLRNYNRDSLQVRDDNILNFTNEAGIIYSRGHSLLVLNTTGKDLAFTTMPALEKASKYLDIPIYLFPQDLQIQKILSPLITIQEGKYCCFLDDFLIISDHKDDLENTINHYLNKSTLGAQEYFQKSSANLAASSSLLAVINTEDFQKNSKEYVADDFISDLEKIDFTNYPLAAVQFIQNDNFAHLHALLANSEISAKKETDKNFSINLDTKLGIDPVLVENHDTQHPEIAVQDQNNVLYLYSLNGDMLWKKQLDGRIMGKIEQVDLYKNGNLQLIFTTPHSLMIIDRNGNEVKPFPIQFNDEITQPLSVFDYDHNKKYRFVVTQKKEIFMLDSEGKSVKGFGFDKAGSEILMPPKHLRIKNKDYIVFPEEDGKLDILSRQGRTRVKVSEKLNFSQTEWFQNSGDFVSLNMNGELLRVDSNGKTRKKNLGNDTNTKLAATSDILVSLTGNILSVNGKEITMDYGLYTNPEIIEAGGKTYITITDLQASKVYVFDEKGDLLTGFPKFGTSPADISNFDGGNTELTIRGGDNTILIYSF